MPDDLERYNEVKRNAAQYGDSNVVGGVTDEPEGEINFTGVQDALDDL